MLGQRGHGSSGDRARQRPVHCEECTIQIGAGYQESIPFEYVEDAPGSKPKRLIVCWRCWESLMRRKAKRQTEAGDEPMSGARR